MELLKHLVPKTAGKALEENIIKGEGFRITVLTPQLLRLEVSEENIFVDKPSQMFWFRDFPKVDFRVVEDGFYKKIVTKQVTFFYHYNKHIIESVSFNGGLGKLYAYNRENLLGTARTLDMKFAACKLEEGILSKRGIAVVDDDSLLLKDDGMFENREPKTSDSYFFAYNMNFLLALHDFFKLSGEIPLIPRYALGNWWSRYRAYTDTEYLEVLSNFKKNKVPLSVATIDMDWHYTDIKKEFNTTDVNLKNPIYGNGWTGYTFNKKLFPDYKKFLQTLHDDNLKITLNLHPASGIRFFESMYETVCKKMNIDPKSKKPVAFDFTDENFINSYFEDVHHPYEKNGVDFWWIDWQQGKKSKLEGFDPLYALNHFHYLDNARTGKTPLILSRYAGIGSHRYPLGFSGDSAMNWKILDFIPYFTANASNVGYTWWSHDIGGHHFGVRDDELFIRWTQFAVFNPILRLHSTSNDLFSKEPWCYGKTAELISSDFLRLRHKLVPYIYSMNVLSNRDGLPLVMPLYYKNAKNDVSYKMPNEYYFGSELLVHPITTKIDKKIKLGRTETYIPKGRWTDMFTGYVYEGETTKYLYRDIYSIPVLAKEGAIIPMNGDNFAFGTDLPTTLELWLYRGNNSFTLYEDLEDNSLRAATTFVMKEENNTITFAKAPSDNDILKQNRNFVLMFKDLTSATKITVKVDKKEIKIEPIIENFVTIKINDIKFDSEIEVSISAYTVPQNPQYHTYAVNILSKMQGRNIIKTLNYKKIKSNDTATFKRKIKHSLYSKFIVKAFEEFE